MWNVAVNLIRQILQFMTMLVLVRLLPPASYGEFSVTTTVITFLTWISFSNFVSHTIQVGTEDDAHYQDHFTAGGVLQSGVFLIANALALGMRFSPTYVKVAPFVHVMSIGLLLGWPAEFRRVMLARRFAWQRIGLLNGIGFVAGAVAGPVLAWSGAGTYALLLPGLILPLPFIADLFLVERWRPTWAWSWPAYRPAFRFGLARITGGAAVGGRLMIESSVLGLALGLTGLGMFTRAVGLAQMFCTAFASELLAAIYPVLARVEGQQGNAARVGALVLRLVFWAALPIAVTLGTLSPQVVRVVYGAQWGPVVQLLPWALAVAVTYAMIVSANSLLLARQQQVRCLALDLMLLAGTLGSLALAPTWGARAYLQALLILQGLVLSVALRWLIQFQALDFRGIREALLPPSSLQRLAGHCPTGVSRPP